MHDMGNLMSDVAKFSASLKGVFGSGIGGPRPGPIVANALANLLLAVGRNGGAGITGRTLLNARGTDQTCEWGR
jgi:hypothetical protein